MTTTPRARAQRFGNYEILHELRSGGMGSVLLARRRGLGNFEQLVAIKTIRAEYVTTEAVRAMFLDEAAILSRVNHPAIATVHDFGEQDGELYMAMEYVAGISFRALADLAPPPVIVARAIAEGSRGLHAAHEVRDTNGTLLGVVHRDVSPDNLMLGYDGRVKLLDFGIALVKNRQAPVTEFGTLKGKPPYMSPEQVKNETLDRRSDVFSLGAVLHELLTNQPLFDGDSIYAVARAVEHGVIPRPSTVIGKPLPIGLDAVVMSALERDVTRRIQTAAELAEQLEDVITSSGGESLAAWAERELAGSQRAHRAWIASLVNGSDKPVTALGRPTGAITALPAVIEPPAPSADDDVAPARPRRGPLVVAVIALLALVAGVVVLRMRGHESVVVVDATSTMPDGPPVVVPDAALDSAPLDAELVDAAVDAPVRVYRDGAVVAQRDAAATVVMLDGGAPPQPPDAAPVALGSGTLVVRHHKKSPSYLEVYVDDVLYGKTPTFGGRALTAGTHAVRLVRPDSGEVVFRTEVVIEDGKTTNLVQPEPR